VKIKRIKVLNQKNKRILKKKNPKNPRKKNPITKKSTIIKKQLRKLAAKQTTKSVKN